LQNLQPISTESIKNRKRDEKILLRKDPVTNQAKSARIPTLLYGFPTFMSIPEIRFYPPTIINHGNLGNRQLWQSWQSWQSSIVAIVNRGNRQSLIHLSEKALVLDDG